MSIIELISKDLERIEKYTISKSNSMKFLLAIYFFVFNNGIRSIIFYRTCNFLYKKNSPWFNVVYSISLLLCSIEINPKTEIGPGLVMPHPQCIVIGGGIIGSNVSIYQGVTIGLSKGNGIYPIIENNVHIGAGAKILGSAHIENNSTIAANSVVSNIIIPKNTIAGGIPAKVIKKNYN